MKKFLVILFLGFLWYDVGFANLEVECLGDNVCLVKTDSSSVFKGKLNAVGKEKSLIFKSY